MISETSAFGQILFWQSGKNAISKYPPPSKILLEILLLLVAKKALKSRQ